MRGIRLRDASSAAPGDSWKSTIYLGGPNRKWSEKYGLTVHLCLVCHRDNRRGVHGDAEKMLAVHQIGQRAFEQKYSHKKFMQVFGKNYLDTEET